MPINFRSLGGVGGMTLDTNQTVTGKKFFNPGTLIDKGQQVYDVTGYGVVGNGVDDNATALATVAAAAAVTGGVIFFPPGDYRTSVGINLDDARNVQLRGVPSVIGSQKGSRLFLTANSGSLLSMKSTLRCGVRDMGLGYRSATYADYLVHIGHSATLNADTGYSYFTGVDFGASTDATPWPCIGLVNVHDVVFCGFNQCTFRRADKGIVGRPTTSGYANVVQIQNTTFYNEINVVPIFGAGQSWLMQGCGFEALNNGKAGAYDQDPAAICDTMGWYSNWMGDVFTSGGIWIQNLKARALAFQNNLAFGTNADVAANLPVMRLVPGCIAVDVTANSTNLNYMLDCPTAAGNTAITELRGGANTAELCPPNFLRQFVTHYNRTAGSSGINQLSPGLLLEGRIPQATLDEVTAAGVLHGVHNIFPASQKAAMLGYMDGIASQPGPAGSVMIRPKSDAATTEVDIYAGDQPIGTPALRLAKGKWAWNGAALQNIPPTVTTFADLAQWLEDSGLINYVP